jgi:hypothetical protein
MNSYLNYSKITGNIYAIRKNPKNGFSQHEMTNINSTIFMIQ